MKKALAMLAAGLLCTIGVADDSDNHPDEALSINVPNGTTVVYSGVISGTSSITKDGAGTLVLSNPDNSFTGGINLLRGYVKAAAAGALGADSNVIAFSGANTHQLIIEVTGAAEFKNPITFTGKESGISYPAIKILGGPVTLSGTIVSDTDFYVQYGSSKDDASANTVTLSGAITLTGGVLGIGAWAPFEIKGKVIAPDVFLGFQGYSQNKTVQLWSRANEIGRLRTYSAPATAKDDYAFGGAQIYMYQNWPSAESYSQFNLNGKKMKVASFDIRPDMSDGYLPRNNSDKGSLFLSYNATTLTVTGQEGDFTCMQRLHGPMNLLIDAVSFRDSFVQRFIDRHHTISGTIAVSNGTMRVGTTSTFASVPAVTVGPNGKLFIDTTNGVVFAGCTRFVVDGEFTVSEDAAKPFTDGSLDLELGAGATFTLPDGMSLQVASLTVGGTSMSAGAFTSNNTAQIKGGAVILPAAGEVAWTAGATPDESISTAGNWGGVLPDILYGTTTAFFGTAGTNVAVDCAARFAAVRIKAPESGKGFSFTSASANASVTVGGDVTIEKDAVNEAVTNVYDFCPPVYTPAASSWTVPANDVVRIASGLTGTDSAASVTKLGAGTMVLGGASEVPGVFNASEGALRLSGRLGPAGDGDMSKALRIEVKNGVHPWAYFEGATVEKDVYFNTSDYSNLRFSDGGTNVFRGKVSTAVARNFFLGEKAALMFEGGVTVNGKMNLCGLNRAEGLVAFRNKPWRTTEYLCVGYDGTSKITLQVETQGSSPRLFVRERSVVDFRVDNANTNAAAFLDLQGTSSSYTGTGTFNFNATTQSFQRVEGGLGKVTGSYPACLVLNQPATYTNNVSGRIEGGVGILKHGEGWLTLAGRDFTSCGDIGVDGGTLEIASDATWLNGTNVYVGGSGTLKLGASGRFNGRFAKIHLGAEVDTWKIDIPAGCQQTVKTAWDANGNPLPCGTYGAVGIQGVTNTRYASHFTSGGGVLIVKQSGFSIVIR